jgi:hypothetical protein
LLNSITWWSKLWGVLYNVGHELFSHLYFFLIGKDPRHGGETRTLNGNPQLEQHIIIRELESKNNFNQ